MIRTGLFALIGLLLVVAMATAIGYMLPKGHRASRTVTYAAPPSEIFAIISDVARSPEWRTGITGVDVLPDDGRGMRFREHGPQDVIAYRVERLEPPSKLVTRIDDPSLPFGGTWTLEVVP